MIGVRFHGRLGNQMFQFAFGLGLEKKFSTTFYVDDSQQQNCLNQYFILRRFNLKYLRIDHIFFKKIIKNLIKRKPFDTFLNDYTRYKIAKENKPYPIIQQIGNEVPLTWRKCLIDKALYVGFFQSSEYLPDLKVIVKRFDIKTAYRKLYEKKYKSIFENSKTIVAHIRRTDYLEWGADELGGINLTLPVSYYLDCMKDIENIDQYKIFFISDDIDFVKKHFERKENLFIEHNEEIIDLQLLLHADILILANSSFSWWGAFLNSKENKRVYVPKYWSGFKVYHEYPIGIIENSWKQIEIKNIIPN